MASITQVVQSPGASSLAQGSSSTAPVLEFTCLFTHDLRRKQKRWQDGRLKFHAFNKRIMVYDERGNTIGDTHWREDHDFAEGEEVQLERGGVIVQAGECVGTRNQDLSELIDKRFQEKAQRQSAAAARHSRPMPSGGLTPIAPRASTPRVQLRHTHLHNVIGTPTGHHGRALAPTESPFEERQKLNALQDESPRPAKRPKREASPPSKNGYAQSLFGTTLTLSGRPMGSAPVRDQVRRTVQVQHGCDVPLSSSDLANQNNNDDEPRQIASPPETMPHIRHVPLSERSAAATNAPQVSITTLTGKNARSKADVPPLLRQRSVQEDNERTNAIRSQVSSTARKSGIPPDTEPESLVAVCKKAVSGPERQKSEVPYAQATRRQLPTEEPPCKKPKVRDTTEVCKKLVAADGQLKQSTQRSAKELVNANTHRPQPTRNNLSETTNKPAPAGPKIELRIKKTKKRGLLMVSEKAQRNRARKSIVDTTETPEISAVASQTVADDLEAGFSFRDRDIGSVSNPKAGRKAHLMPPVNENSDLSESAVDPIATREHLQTDIKTKAATVRGQQEDVDTVLVIHPEVQAMNKDFRQSYIATATHIPLALEDQHFEISDDFLEDLKPSQQLPEVGRRQVETATFLCTDAVIMDGQNLEGKQRHEAVRAPQKRAPEVTTDSLVEQRDAPDESHEELSGEVHGHVPLPRLAQLPRRNIRSKEVIGWIYKEDEAHIKDRYLANQSGTSKLQQNVPAVPTSTIPDRIGLQLEPEAMSLPSKGRDDTHYLEVELPSLDEQRVMLAEQDCSTLGPHTILAEQTPGSPVKPSDSQKEAVAYPPGTNFKLMGLAVAHQDQQGGVSNATTNDLKVPHPNLPELPEIEEKQITNKGINVESQISTTWAKLGRSTGLPPKATREVSAPTSRVARAEHFTNIEIPSQSVQINQRCRTDRGALGQSHLVSNEAVLASEELPNTGKARPDALVDQTENTLRQKEQMPRLVNPATRGRKAAQPTDAAGKVPECILPPPDGAASITREAKRPIVRILNRAAQKSSPLPGFTRANGGAWSREAFDLFEYVKPS